MKTELTLVTTADGSKTIWNEQVGEHYHSKHGALQESKHVFLDSGLHYYLNNNPQNEVAVLEVGFGTGLNFLLTADDCIKNKIALNYTGIEAYPLDIELILQTNYNNYVQNNLWNQFISNYESAKHHDSIIHDYCTLEIADTFLSHFTTSKAFDVLYFDAFAAIHQPEMWLTDSLIKCCQHLKPGGVFVTYAITGNLKRAMKAIGFKIQKAPGAPGKREMLRAIKI